MRRRRRARARSAQSRYRRSSWARVCQVRVRAHLLQHTQGDSSRP
jgi:hypothetical protein